MGLFLTADTHFHHRNILKYTNRPFQTIEEMNGEMIKAWNKNIRKEDTVYHLGDFCFGNYESWAEIITQLNGSIHLIGGNHDDFEIAERLFKENILKGFHPLGTIIKHGNFTLNLTHYPMLIGLRPKNFSIHGHIHQHEIDELNTVNIGVDSQLAKSRKKEMFGTPIPLEDLMIYLNQLNMKIIEARRAGRY